MNHSSKDRSFKFLSVLKIFCMFWKCLSRSFKWLKFHLNLLCLCLCLFYKYWSKNILLSSKDTQLVAQKVFRTPLLWQKSNKIVRREKHFSNKKTDLAVRENIDFRMPLVTFKADVSTGVDCIHLCVKNSGPLSHCDSFPDARSINSAVHLDSDFWTVCVKTEQKFGSTMSPQLAIRFNHFIWEINVGLPIHSVGHVGH